MKRVLNGINYSFPIQLLLLHLKKNHFLLLFWIFIALLITNSIASRYGLALLFLDPEYLGHVSFMSFFFVGVSFGAFFMVWNVTSYILFASNFSFLATLLRPFGVYCLNNAILPLLFFFLYVLKIISFQAQEGLVELGRLSIYLGGFVSGIIVFMGISMLYFFRTNKNIFQVITFKNKKDGLEKNGAEELTHEQLGISDKIKVEYYINHALRLKLTRSADHYPQSLIKSVYKQHYANALFIELSGLLLIILLGFSIDVPAFRIPTASSILLLFAIFIILIGAFSHWLRQWKFIAFIIVALIANVCMRYNLLSYHNKAYGIDYNYKAIYSPKSLNQLCDSTHIEQDKAHTITILNAWKNKFPYTNNQKPKIVFINCSGGGLRASAFVMHALQQADSITDHALMQHCVLMTGASGGMLAAAYYRELYLRHLQGALLNIYDTKYLDNISSDILNAVGFTLVVNDLFYPWQKFTYAGNTYRKDRGYIFERVLNENTDSVLFKPLSAYALPEQTMQIPMMILTPTILNDERKLLIGAQSFSYLALPASGSVLNTQPAIDGVDIHGLMAQNSVDSLAFTSALRMNCTFPYILPTVHLPTQPEIQLLDAGVRDNYGVETSVRFISTFKNWIIENTSGVVFLNIRGIEQVMNVENETSNGIIQKILDPVGNLYTNWAVIQDYQQAYLLSELNDVLKGNMQIITIDYNPELNTKRASLSFHLTAREKRDVKNATTSTGNIDAYQQLKSILK